MSYDNFHANADRIYRINIALFKWDTVETSGSGTIQRGVSYPIVNWLKSNIPEIEDATGIRIVDGSNRPDNFSILYLDYSFSNIFDLDLPEDFFVQSGTRRAVALTPELYNEGYLEYLRERSNWDVRATIPSWQANTNIRFNAVAPLTSRFREEALNNWRPSVDVDVYILVHSDVDIEALKTKLDKVEIPELWPNPVSLVLTPITRLRYDDPTGNIASDIKFSHIRIFAIAGLLVILCSLFNHMTLFVTRVSMRLRELALRKVNGATNWQIAVALYTDFMVVKLLALVIGFMLMTLLLPTFMEYATIGKSNIKVYSELMLYAFLLITCGIVVGGVPVLYSRKQVLNESIKGAGSPGSRNTFRKSSLLIQLIISLGMMFCSTVFIKQIIFLQNTDLGVERRNIASVQAACCPFFPHYAEQIKQVPGIVYAILIDRNGFLRNMSSSSGTGITFDSLGNQISYTLFNIKADSRFFDFFGVEIIQGTVFSNVSEHYLNYVINETAMKELGEELSKSEYFVGVARDFYLTPTIKAKPTKISYPDPSWNFLSAIAYKYEEGMRQQVQQSVTQWYRNEFPDKGEFEINFTYMEDVFEEYFKSERALLKLLSVMTLACILIAVFGVYSLASLTCRQRRREIAIRKVHGAEVLDIMNIFFKEYLILLGLAALAAFPAGFLIMKRWLEGYVKQTSMDAWLYVAIFLAVFVVIVFSIFSTIWRAANRNPAEVVKSE